MSLRHISIKDFVIVRALALDFSAGFTVLTGETGAGKSILIDALQLVLGDRAEAGVVREGATRTEIEAQFDCPALLLPWLDQAGFEAVPEGLLLRRVIDLQGRSRAWINGSTATAAQLRSVGEYLLDIHGQHAWQSLTRAESVRALLDAYAGVDAQSLAAPWQAWRQAHQALQEAQKAQDGLLHERERLSWQIAELDKLAPAAGEWEDLNTQHTRLAHVQTLLEAAQQASQWLDEDETGVLSRLAAAQQALAQQRHLEPGFGAVLEVLANSLAQAEDAAHSLHSYLRKTELDPQRYAELDQRLSQWMALARRYKRMPEELPSVLQAWKQELTALDAAADTESLAQAEQAARAVLDALVQQLSQARGAAAPKLAQAVTQAMQSLGMQGGRFEVSLQPLPQVSAQGMESVEFLVSGHAGSTPRPVGKVASGGELSRIALAIAVTTSRLGSAQTLIFDEVDAGVGGAVADTVGRLMQQLGRDRQVLAVTHLPQVAACADHHLVVSKTLDGQAVHSSVQGVQGELRVSELARMLGGERLSEASRAHAKDLLSHAR